MTLLLRVQPSSVEAIDTTAKRPVRKWAVSRIQHMHHPLWAYSGPAPGVLEPAGADELSDQAQPSLSLSLSLSLARSLALSRSLALALSLSRAHALSLSLARALSL